MSDKPNNKKIGTIVIAVQTVEASWPELCRTVFSRFCPFRTDLSPNSDRIAYTGFSEQFDEIGDDGTPPRYTVQCGYNNGVVQSVSFSRIPPDEAKKADVEPEMDVGNTETTE